MNLEANFRRCFLGLGATAALMVALGGCGGGGSSAPPEKCEIQAGGGDAGADAGAPPYLTKIGCQADFVALSSAPLSSTLPGARSGKVVLDTFDGTNTGEHLYFQNSVKYQIHYQFASMHLSGPSRKTVPNLGEFNRIEYYSNERRFILGTVTYYEAPDIWALQLAPYDTATAAMIEKLFNQVKAATFFGSKLVFNPMSEAVEAEAKKLPASIPIKTTDEIFAKIDYQPLNLATSCGKLRFVKAADLPNIYLNFRDIVVLDHVPNDISVVLGMITEEFQTPLSHINVLAQNRRIPNMGLRAATMNAELKALEGKWAELRVGASDWGVKEKSKEEADAWWELNKPKPPKIPDMDLTVTELKNVENLVDESTPMPLGEAIKKSILAYGGKAANYGVLKNTPGVPVRPGFAIPVFYYDQFMKQNGFYLRVDQMLADPAFQDDPAVRDATLAKLREDMEKAPVDPAFSAMLKAKLETDFPGMTMRFRTSTNAEDQEDFLCAGCYDSHTGNPANWDVDRTTCNATRTRDCSVLQAVRKTWAGVWYFRTYEERSYNSIDQKKIGMALLVHHNFLNEFANGVAVTANIFDSSGLEPAFYINVQTGGDAEVVAPPPGVYSDEILYYYSYDMMPIFYLGHSNLTIPMGSNVLSTAQIRTLGTVLQLVHNRFSPAYGPMAGNNGFYALEVDIKFELGDNPTPTTVPELFIKQARNYRGRAAQ